MLRTLILASAFTAVVTPATAQLDTFGGNGEMRTSSVYLWDSGAKKLAGSYSFIYGSPEWRDEHNAQVKSDTDGSIRLGKNEWATLDTSVALKIGGTMIPAGQWYLGLRREGGKFSLMVMEAEAVRKMKAGSWMTEQMKAKINAPLEYSEVEEKTAKLTIVAEADKKDPVHGTFTVRWGNHQLSAKIEVVLGAKGAKDAGHEKDGKPAKRQGR